MWWINELTGEVMDNPLPILIHYENHNSISSHVKDKPKILQIMLILIFSIVSIMIDIAGIAYANYVFGIDSSIHRKILHDVLLDYFFLPEIVFLYAKAYVLILFLIFFTVIFMHVNGFVVLRRFIVCLSTIFLTRGVFLFTTQFSVPHSINNCPRYDNMKFLNILGTASVYVVSLGFSKSGYGGCGDLVFSSQAAVAIMLSLFIIYYTNLHIILRIGIFLTTVAYCVLNILSRRNYTLDVLTACLAVFWIFMTYHAYIKLEAIKHKIIEKQTIMHVFESLKSAFIICNFTTVLFEENTQDFENRFINICHRNTNVKINENM